MKYFTGFFLLLLVIACTSPEPASLTGDEPVSFKAFTALFPDLELPYTQADTSLLRKESDSLAIKPKLFVQFVPDSIQHKAFGKGKVRIFPVEYF